MPNMQLDMIERWYASVVTRPSIYRDNPPLVALAIIQRAQEQRERLIVEAWTRHICNNLN